MSRLGCEAAPAICALVLKPWGRFAAQSRHKAAPTGSFTGQKLDARHVRSLWEITLPFELALFDVTPKYRVSAAYRIAAHIRD